MYQLFDLVIVLEILLLHCFLKGRSSFQRQLITFNQTGDMDEQKLPCPHIDIWKIKAFSVITGEWGEQVTMDKNPTSLVKNKDGNEAYQIFIFIRQIKNC